MEKSKLLLEENGVSDAIIKQPMTLADIYNKSYQIAEQTYRQGAEVLNEATGNAPAAQEPSPGNANVEDSK